MCNRDSIRIYIITLEPLTLKPPRCAQDLWKCSVVSCTVTLAADPLSAMGYRACVDQTCLSSAFYRCYSRSDLDAGPQVQQTVMHWVFLCPSSIIFFLGQFVLHWLKIGPRFPN